MESFNIKNLSFTYPNREKKALDSINLKINEGEFICLFGKSGCGKTTLLRLLKSALAPHGKKEGEILFQENPLDEYNFIEQAREIGFVMQNVDNQIVTDKVWHELAFGLENLGVPSNEIRVRVAEMASFFGIGEWFHKKISELSGGQKQILNLASVMVMQPSVLILDEPTSQLDPIAASEFIRTLEKINKEFGTTIILSEHRLEEVFAISDRVICMEDGKIIADGTPYGLGKKLIKTDMFLSLPTPARVYSEVEKGEHSPITVREGKKWLKEYAKENSLNTQLISDDIYEISDVLIELKDVWFRYKKESEDVIKNLCLMVNKGEILSVLGGNGSGKTTMLSLILGINRPYRGKVLRKEMSIGALPQNPQCLFTKNTVLKDLLDICNNEEDVMKTAKLCQITDLLDYHPYDLSGGEQQRAALCKVLLKSPEILLLDEPTKGFDAQFKKIFLKVLKELKKSGKTVVMVSHDIEFCAEVSDRCAMFFDGNITSIETTRRFFKNNTFYTTSANKMAKNIIPDAVLAEDIVLACRKKEIRE